MKKQWFTCLAILLGVIGSNALGQYPNPQYGWAPYVNAQQTNANQYGVSQYAPAQYGTTGPAAVNMGGYSAFDASAYSPPTQSILQNVPQVPATYETLTPTPAPPHPVAGFAAPQPVAGFAAPQPAPSLTAQYSVQPYAAPSQFQLVTAQNQAAAQPQTPALETVPSPAAQYQMPVYPNTSPALTQPAAPAATAPSTSCQTCGPTTQTYFPQTHYGWASPGTSVAPNCVSCGPAPISHAYARPAHKSFLCGLPACARPWFFGAGFMLYSRIDDKDVPLAFFDTAYSPHTITTRQARQLASPGNYVFAGRYFNCGRNAIVADYWGIYPELQDESRVRTTPGDYRSRIPYNYAMMSGTPTAPGVPYSVYDWYDNAYTHVLRRSSAYYSFGVNLLGFGAGCAARNFNCGTKVHLGGGCGSCGGSGCTSCASACGTACAPCKPTKLATGPCCLIPPSCGSCLNLTWLTGFRYFRFEDNLYFASSLGDSMLNRSADDLYYDVNTTNDLVGFQAGARLDVCCGKCVNLFGLANVGIYNNHATLYSRLGTDYDVAYIDDTRTPGNPYNGQAYMFNESKDQIAFLSEIGAGVGYRPWCCWSINLGYRAIIASGVATSVGNLRSTFDNYADIRDFHVNDTLVLHGFDVGATYNF